MKPDAILQPLYQYFKDDSQYAGIIVYGSFAEQLSGFICEPRDIDVLVVMLEYQEKREEITITLPEYDLPINVEFMTRDDFIESLCEGLPAKFTCTYGSSQTLQMRVAWSALKRGWVRKHISRQADRAWDKGRKKLVIVDDYDPVLGLKNIYHAFKFPILAMNSWYITPDDFEKYYMVQHDMSVLYLYRIHRNIHKIYYETEGTLDERCRAVLEYAKPLHRKLMTEFRKRFPKE